MKILTAVLVAWLTIASTFAAAQTGNKLSGQVLLADGNPAAAATVTLIKAADSTTVKMLLANTDGRFAFDGVSNGAYRLSITLVGYQKYKSAGIDMSGQAVDLPAIKLVQDGIMLKDVGVTSKKQFIVHKQDRTIVNVDALISGAGTTALEILEKSPGVQVDQNGGVSLKGKQGVTIFIDDKPTYMSGDDLANYLRSLPSSSLDQIEIMTNPPAKYDAAGNAGVINIKTKKNSVRGFNGGLNLSGNQGQLFRSNNSFNFNYRNNKLNIFGNLSHNLNNSFTDLDLNRMYKNADGSAKSYFEQNTYFKRHGNAVNLKTGADYYVSENTTCGVVFTGMLRKSSQKNNNTSNLYSSTRQLDSIIVAQNLDNLNYKNGGINLNYRTQFDKNGHELTADADFLTYRNKTEQSYLNNSYFPDRTPKFQDILTGYLPNHINIYSLKTDYSRPLNNGWKFAAGAKASYAKTNNIADYSYTINNITKPDYDKSNQFIYKENINAAYVNMSREGKHLSVQAGLRLENTYSDGHQLGNIMKPDSMFKRRYTNLFPTVYLSYKFDTLANNQVGINYGRRIDRPYYQDLNPFISPLDKFTYYVGNPFLKPAFTNSFELSHTYKNKITTTLSYSKIKDDVNETIEITNGLYFSRPGNIGTKEIKTISVDAGFDPAKWLNIHAYTEFTNISSRSNFYTGQLNTSGSYWFINSNARITLGKGWDGELSGNYRTKLYDAQFIIGTLWQANAALQKKLSSSTTLKMSVNDIFYSRKVTGQITNLASADASWVNKADSRFVTLSLSYRFGKAIANQRKHDATGAESEQNRVKN